MSTRSDEVDVLNDLGTVINNVLANNLDSVAQSVCSARFVPQPTVDDILTQGGGNISKARKIMSAIKATITTESTPEDVLISL